MKTEWTFPWKSYDFRFKKEHRFVATVRDDTADAPGPANSLEAQIKIVPAEGAPHDRSVEQTGDLLITIPLRPKEGEPLAYTAARSVGEQVAFRNGDFRVEYGFVACRRIAETPEEEAEIDDKPYSVRINLQQVIAAPEFDSAAIPSLGHVDVALLAQYNQTKRDDNPIRQFLGFFRIIETTSYSSPARKPLKQALKENSLLQAHFLSLLPQESFDEYVEQIVEIRHKCAHWRGDVGFGYAPSDPAVKEEVLPELRLLQELAYRCIDGIKP
jgi:hypothetical protein